MSDVEPSAIPQLVVENLIREFAGPLRDHTGCRVDVDLRRDQRGNLRARYTVTLELTETLDVDITLLALRHAADPQAFIRELVTDELVPFDEHIKVRANRATAAWGRR